MTRADPSPRPFGERINILLIAKAISIILSIVIAYVVCRVMYVAFFTDGEMNLSGFSRVFHASGSFRSIVDTIIYIGASTLIAGLVGTLFAWLNERTTARIGFVGTIIPIIPLLVPVLAGTIGWVILLTPRAGYINAYIVKACELLGMTVSPDGPFNIYGSAGLIFVYTLYLIPHIYLTVAASLRNVDVQLEEASGICGANILKTITRVTAPAVLPAIISGGVLALMMGLTIYSIPVIIGTPANIEILSVRIVSLMTNHFPADIASAIILSGFLVILMIFLFLTNGYLRRLGRFSSLSGKSSYFSLVQLPSWANILARMAIFFYLLAGSLLPLSALLILSMQRFWQPNIVFSDFSIKNYVTVLSNQVGSITALGNSIFLGMLGASIAVAISLLIGYLRFNNPFSWAGRVGAMSTKAAAALSHIVIAIGFVAGFAGSPFHLHGSLILLLLAYVILYLPQASVSADSAINEVGKSLIDASLMSHATYGRTLMSVVLPLSKGGLTAGWVFAFILIAGDVTASFMLATPTTPVVSFVMLNGFTAGNYGVVAVLGVLLSLIFIVIVPGVLILSRIRFSARI